jgi:hypothetical protein
MLRQVVDVTIWQHVVKQHGSTDNGFKFHTFGKLTIDGFWESSFATFRHRIQIQEERRKAGRLVPVFDAGVDKIVMGLIFFTVLLTANTS